MLKFKCFGIDLFAVCPRRRHKCSHDTNPSSPSPFLLQPKIRRERGEVRHSIYSICNARHRRGPFLDLRLHFFPSFSPSLLAYASCHPNLQYNPEKGSFKLLKSKCKNAWQMAIEWVSEWHWKACNLLLAAGQYAISNQSSTMRGNGNEVEVDRTVK